MIEDFEREGWARIHGENWRVKCAARLQRGQKVRVAKIDGLTLEVVPESLPDKVES